MNQETWASTFSQKISRNRARIWGGVLKGECDTVLTHQFSSFCNTSNKIKYTKERRGRLTRRNLAFKEMSTKWKREYLNFRTTMRKLRKYVYSAITEYRCKISDYVSRNFLLYAQDFKRQFCANCCFMSYARLLERSENVAFRKMWWIDEYLHICSSATYRLHTYLLFLQ